MSRIRYILIGLILTMGAGLVFSQTEIGKSTMDQPIGGIIQMTIAGAALVVFLVGILMAAFAGFLAQPEKDEANGIAVARYEGGVTIIDIQGEQAIRFTKNRETGRLEYAGEVPVVRGELVVGQNH